jgi:hypothetical protein
MVDMYGPIRAMNSGRTRTSNNEDDVVSHVRQHVQLARLVASTMTSARGLKPPWTSRYQERGCAAWKEAEAVLMPSLPLIRVNQLALESVRRFNRLMRTAAPTFELVEFESAALQVRAVHFRFKYGDEVVGRIVERLLELFVTSACERLRRCEQCTRWFADSTKNKGARQCSARCRDRWWNRQRRRAAKHGQNKARRIGSARANRKRP